MDLFDYWTFQNSIQMLSHDKIIFHILFGAFHVTSRKNLSVVFSPYPKSIFLMSFPFKIFQLRNILQNKNKASNSMISKSKKNKSGGSILLSEANERFDQACVRLTD